ncbi:MAG: exonuclease SbcCD subunit D [Acidobacteriota bacterium]
MRLLLLSDSHLGFDLPFRPRIERRRRGPDFFANFERALAPARQGRVDAVLHGGDLLYRSRVPADLVAMAFEPLKEVASRGTPVYLVPGNHERSRIPRGLLALHPHIFIFDRPRTYLLERDGFVLALAGFPSVRNGVRGTFRSLVEETGWCRADCQASVLCFHQLVEGATVGPSGYTFRTGDDVIRASDIPGGLTAVLSGHVHRHQVLTRDLAGRPIPPVLYPGSTERTSFAEKDESKGFLTMGFAGDAEDSAALHWRFHQLPARPMIELEVTPNGFTGPRLRAHIQRRLDGLPRGSVVRLRIRGPLPAGCKEVLGAATLRSLAPSSMNIACSSY